MTLNTPEPQSAAPAFVPSESLEEARERRLDAALEESFPASDPIASGRFD